MLLSGADGTAAFYGTGSEELSYPANDDGRLVDQRERLASCYISYRPELLRFLTARFRCSAAAEDVVQDVYVRASAARSVVQDPRAFLFTTAANLMRNAMRANGRRAARSSFADLLAPAYDSITPEQALLDAEELGRAREAILALPPQCRRVFELHRFEGFTQREVADRLGISRTAVEKHMRVAMARLSAAVERG